MKYKNHPIILFKSLGLVFFSLLIIVSMLISMVTEGIKKVGWSEVKNTLQGLFKYLSSMDFSSTNKYVLLGVIAYFLWIIFSFIRYFFYWKNSEIVLTEEHLHSNRVGLFYKAHKQVPLKKISNVNLKRNLFYTLFNVYEVKVDIDSSETANEADYSIVLSNQNAHKLMNDIYRIKGVEKGSHATKHNIKDTITNDNIKVDDSKNNNDSIKTENIKFAYKFGFWESIRHLILDLAMINIVLTVIGIISVKYGSLFILLVAVLSVFKQLIQSFDRAFGFQIQREKDTIQLSYGLMNTNTFTIPLSNVISISTHQSILARVFKKKCLKLNLIGFANNPNETGLISLYMSEKELEEYAEKVIPELSMFEENKQILIDNGKLNSSDTLNNAEILSDNKTLNSSKLSDIHNEGNPVIEKPNNVLYYHFMLYSILFLPFGIIISIPLKMYWIIFIPVPLIFLMSLISFYKVRIRITDKSIIAIKGIFSKETEIFPYSKIESVKLSQNIISKNFNICSLTVFYKGGALGVDSFDTGYYKVGTFDEIMKYYKNGEKKQ